MTQGVDTDTYVHTILSKVTIKYNQCTQKPILPSLRKVGAKRVPCRDIFLMSPMTQHTTSSEVGNGRLPEKISEPLNVRRLHRSQTGSTVTAQGEFHCGPQGEAVTFHFHQTKTKARRTTATETKRRRTVMMLRKKDEMREGEDGQSNVVVVVVAAAAAAAAACEGGT